MLASVGQGVLESRKDLGEAGGDKGEDLDLKSLYSKEETVETPTVAPLERVLSQPLAAVGLVVGS